MNIVRCTITTLVVVIAGFATTAGAAHKHASSHPNDIIYDLSRPWPFHESGPADDTDGDGVLDRDDRCPGTPDGATVDAYGCPTDKDGDGVPDGIDRCPETTRGATVDRFGCPKDSDGDGVVDGRDQCPKTPHGATVDATGCPSDADRDGVVDGVDQCPGTSMDYAVDSKGCPIPVSETYQQFLDSKSVSINIEFASSKSDIMHASEADLHKVGEVLADWPEAKVEIGGHTDAQGAEKFNQTLSRQRAESVKTWLTSNYSKINGSHLETKGYGEKDPIASNDTPEGRAQNRRVTFTLLNAKDLGKEVETRHFKKRSQ
jgi:OmpA-OmpF porin, OOP family